MHENKPGRSRRSRREVTNIPSKTTHPRKQPFRTPTQTPPPNTAHIKPRQSLAKPLKAKVQSPKPPSQRYALGFLTRRNLRQAPPGLRRCVWFLGELCFEVVKSIVRVLKFQQYLELGFRVFRLRFFKAFYKAPKARR